SLELNAHADAAIAPGHAPFGVDIALGARHPEPDADFRAGFERARGADRQPAMSEVEREGGGDGVAEPVLHRNPENRSRTATAIEVIRKQMRRQGRQNMLPGAVLVEISGDTQ